MLELLDYRRRVFELYQQVRAAHGDPAAWAHWRQGRDDLFRSHPQSALDAAQKATFTGLRYYAYDPDYRVVTRIDRAVEDKLYEGEIGADGHIAYRRFAQVTFELPTGTGRLSLFWIMGYGGGVFLPFRDATNRATTYGAGRYLYDTLKGADLGTTTDTIVLDFNYAYHPSCAYNPRWVCPLAPPENWLDFPIPVGERLA
ncbi:MAG: DUF1684 domain-containing protein [Anaerolineae bacterium]|nr:DUF1684 domain-containing protein [Anaerolineae bacterium]